MRSHHTWSHSITDLITLPCLWFPALQFLSFPAVHQAHTLYIIDEYNSELYYMMPNLHDMNLDDTKISQFNKAIEFLCDLRHWNFVNYSKQK